jgi:hypothetical protein
MNGSVNIDRAAIAERNEQLEQARLTLRAKFVGIEEVIDDLIDAMRVWWLMPEVLTRPVIINLWGMTGVGKTDLVRRLVNELQMQDRFAEVELSNGDTTSYRSSVAQVLATNQIVDGKPAIVLFDEIQRFNTLDTDGKPLQNTKFTDFWELLSDGRLAKRERTDLDYMLNELRFNMRDAQRRKERGEEVEVDTTVGWWQASSMKETLGLEESTDAIAEMHQSEIVERIAKARSAKKVYEPVDHSKTLCIISGNLDDAYSMATMTSEADVDADIFYAFTKKITVVDIKTALSRRFKPEQVARFGNVHLIYTSLRRSHFEELINRELQRITDTTQDRFGIEVSFTPAIGALTYRNGVFPVQGVRPVFSSVADIVESNLARFLFEALMIGATKVSVDYDASRSVLVGIVGKGRKTLSTLERPYTGRLDRVRERNMSDVVANVSVHEAGHAVAYAVLLGLAPLQLTAKVASSYAAGFTFPHDVHETKAQILSKIKVLLAGGIAEEIVFGDMNATTGRSHDREQATMQTLDFVRKYGFDREFQAHYGLDFSYVMDKTVTDLDVEKMVSRLVAETHELLVEHQKMLVALGAALHRAGKLEAHDVAEICGRFGVSALVKQEGYLHIPPYSTMLSDRA